MFSRLELAIYFLFIFFILNEWLRPVLVLTKTGYYHLILVFIGLSLFLIWLKLPAAISWLIRIGYICWFIVYVYTDVSLFSGEGLIFLLDVMQQNLSLILYFDFKSITDPFRSVLLFILIWMLIYLIHHWIVTKLNIFYFLFMTIIFIGTLDTFTKYDGTTAIVKVVFIGLIMTAFLYLKRLMVEKKIHFDYGKYLKMVIPLILLVGCISLLSVLLPKAAPQWPDPVPYIKSAASGELFKKDNRIAKVGYDEDDSQLGGPFIGDDTVIFKVIDDKKQYWRIETKNIYTSKGWLSSDYFDTQTYYMPGEDIFHFLPFGPEENATSATIINEMGNDYFLYPYGLRKFLLDDTDENFESVAFEDTFIFKDENTEKFTINSDLNSYVVEYSTPVYQYSELINPPEEENISIDSIYLQLPDSLPQRVVDLAQQIVHDKESIYEKARAIEMYFKQNGFRYDTENVAVPEENQDYVDQFLFETKIGYCDNFSTAMTVMLRAVGIPARWVKGFVTGDIVDTIDGRNIYEITNNEAHSWVEAFIPGIGWVNFEPTIGFANNRSIEFDIETDNPEENMVEAEEETKPEQKMEDKKETKKAEGINVIEEVKNFFKENLIWISAILSVLLALIILLFILRKKWYWRFALRKIKNKPMANENFEQHYLLLLKVLERKGLKRKDGQTLSSFAKSVDDKYNTDVMSEITSKYERFIYSKEKDNIDFKKMKEIWQFLVNHSTS